MVLDFRDLSWRELLIGAAGIALVVALFVPDWYGVRAEEIFRDDAILKNAEVDARNAFGSFTWLDVGLLVTAIAAIALPLLSAVRPELRLGRWPALVVAALAAVSVALIVLRLIDLPDLARTITVDGREVRMRVGAVPGADVFRKLGVWLGLALTAVIAVAAGLQARRPD